MLKISITSAFVFIFTLSCCVNVESQLLNYRSNSVPQNSGNPITEFALTLIKNFRTKPSNNLIVSPISAQFLLSALERGAGGNTKYQLQNAIGSISTEQMNSILRRNTTGLKTALGLFYDYHFAIEDSYKEKTRQILANIQGLDLRNPLSKKAINKWASDVTKGKISSLIPESYPLYNSRAIILSAIYFHNLWKYKFNPIGNKQFITGDQRSVSVPFMQIVQHIPFNDINIGGVECSVIRLPYKNEKYAMVIIVPKQNIDLDTVFSKINSYQLDEMMINNNIKHINLQMPKFSVKTKLTLVKSLAMMGVTDIFNDHSDLSGISRTANLQVSDVLQQASLDVDENGTTAAAVTGAILIPLSANFRYEPPRLFVIDKPFISFIFDRVYNSTLFISKVNNPAYV